MIYTIGHELNYVETLKKSESGVVYKLGEREDYEGGYAFKSQSDAQKRIDEQYKDMEFGIFGLEADWDRDTRESKNGWWNVLVNDAKIIFSIDQMRSRV